MRSSWIGSLCVAALIYTFAVASISSTSAQPETIEIICRKSVFTPTQIRIKQGVTTRIVLRSEDVTHGFAIDEFQIAREVVPGQPVTVRLTPDKKGEFPFYCVVRCSRDHLKMRGTLIVE